jgi:hypothetical protein
VPPALGAQNAFLERINITLRHPDAAYDTQGFLLVGGRRLNPARNSYYRIFKESFLHCGRWYGPWWQSVPSRIRNGIYLNGEPTCEPDIRGCHIRLLCAAAGIELGDADPYDGLGLRRGDVKLAINIMLNASGWRSARAALVEHLHDDYGAAAAAHVDLIKGAIERRFPELRRFWNTGCGLVLQNVDADICARVQRKVAGTKCAGAIGTRQLRRPAICAPIRRDGNHRGVPTCMPTRSQEQAANSLCRHSKTEKVLTIWNMEYGYGWWNMDMGDLLDRRRRQLTAATLLCHV